MLRTPRRFLIGGLLLAAALICFVLLRDRQPAPASREPRLPPIDAPERATTLVSRPEENPASSDPAVVSFREFAVEAPLIEIAYRSGDPAALPMFSVRLSSGRVSEVEVATFEELGSDEGVYSGAVRGQPDSRAVFSYVGLAYAGTIVLPTEQRAFYVTATEDGLQRVTELDLTKAPGCGEPLLVAAEATAPDLP